MQDARVRLHVDQPLAAGQPVPLSRDQAHYLFTVMRLGPGDAVAVFNGRDGEWRAAVSDAGRRSGTLVVEAALRPAQPPPDLWLLFAPLKKARTDFVVEKAVELGAARILPVQTAFTNAERLREDRLRAHAVEAAEQCGAVFVPEVAPLAPLAQILTDWDAARRLWWCDEALAVASGPPAFAPGPAAILVGPEGGLAPPERARLAVLPFARAIRLGPRILRAETAALAALALWQAAAGDWR
ncbi:MAG: 16S rRNA (uracil(1498)-N(3))-methyltransferase [Gemmobacter sp.]